VIPARVGLGGRPPKLRRPHRDDPEPQQTASPPPSTRHEARPTRYRSGSSHHRPCPADSSRRRSRPHQAGSSRRDNTCLRFHTGRDCWYSTAVPLANSCHSDRESGHPADSTAPHSQVAGSAESSRGSTGWVTRRGSRRSRGRHSRPAARVAGVAGAVEAAGSR
jgi:hypothetical protein